MQHTMSIWPALELTTIRLVIYTIEFACRILLSKITNKVLESRRNLKIESKFRHKFDSRWPTLIIVSIFCVWCLTWGLIIYPVISTKIGVLLNNFFAELDQDSLKSCVKLTWCIIKEVSKYAGGAQNRKSIN